jgi:hypothetical protein
MRPGDKDKPRKFFNSVYDSGYYREKQYYVGTRLLAGGRRRNRTNAVVSDDEEGQLRFWLQRLRVCWKPNYGGQPDFSKSVNGTNIDEGAVIRIIKQAFDRFGFDVVRISRFLEIQHRNMLANNEGSETKDDFGNDNSSWLNDPPDSRLGIRDELGACICEFLRYWRVQAAHKTDREKRRRAARILGDVLKTLIPDMRGRGSVDPSAVKRFYFAELFRIYQIAKALKTRRPGTRKAKLQSVSKNFEIPVNVIIDFWGLDEEGEFKRRRFRFKEMARQLTGRHFHITQQTIENYLSR